MSEINVQGVEMNAKKILNTIEAGNIRKTPSYTEEFKNKKIAKFLSYDCLWIYFLRKKCYNMLVNDRNKQFCY